MQIQAFINLIYSSIFISILSIIRKHQILHSLLGLGMIRIFVILILNDS